MAELHAKNVLYCHAPPTIGPQLLHDNIAYFDKVEAICRKALANGFALQSVPSDYLATALHSELATMLPTTGSWAEVSPEHYSEQHAELLHFMLEWLMQDSG
jgi:hypothetical protein